MLPAPLLATLHHPLIDTPSELRGSSWRKTRLSSAGYALGWRAFSYAGHDIAFHGGAVQGYRGAMALLPDQDIGIAILWNSESALPSGLLPTILDSALGISGGQWLKASPCRQPSMSIRTMRRPAAIPRRQAARHIESGDVQIQGTHQHASLSI